MHNYFTIEPCKFGLENIDSQYEIHKQFKKNECNKKPHTLNQNEKYLLTIEKS